MPSKKKCPEKSKEIWIICEGDDIIDRYPENVTKEKAIELINDMLLQDDSIDPSEVEVIRGVRYKLNVGVLTLEET